MHAHISAPQPRETRVLSYWLFSWGLEHKHGMRGGRTSTKAALKAQAARLARRLSKLAIREQTAELEAQ